MKKLGIIGELFFIAALVIGYFIDFDSAEIVSIAAAAFGAAAIITAAIKTGKEKGLKQWQALTVIVLAVVGGVLCSIGGLTQSIFNEVAGATLALMAVIFGIVSASNRK